jgi:hypothetical protein
MEPPARYGLKHRSIFRSPVRERPPGSSGQGGHEIGVGLIPGCGALAQVATVMIDSAASKIRSRRRQWRETSGMAIPTRDQVRFRMTETAADRDAMSRQTKQ